MCGNSARAKQNTGRLIGRLVNMDEHDLVQAILDAGLDASLEEDGEAMTTNEIAGDSGLAHGVIRGLLKSLMSEGYVEATYVLRETMRTPLTGKLTRVPGYRLTDAGKKALGKSMIQA